MDDSNVSGARVAPSGLGWPAWWLVCQRELHELWVGGKALRLLLVYTVIVGGVSFVSVQNSLQDPTPPKELVWSTLQICVYVSVCMGLIIGADSVSGARERAALEMLLLTPASRRQIVVGKFLASLSPWPAALAVTAPCLAVLSQGDPIFGAALAWGAFLGTLVVVGFVALAMLVSYWSSSNRTSLFVSLTLYLLFLLPALLPGRAQKGLVGKFFQRANPLAAVDQLLERLLVNNNTFHDYRSWLQGPLSFLILVMGLLFLYAAPRLRLYPGRVRLPRLRRVRIARGLPVAIGGK